MSTSRKSARPTAQGRGRRPSAAVRAAMIAAAGDLLFDEGMDAVTFDRVAALSATSRTTLYKYWPTPGALAAEAYFARVNRALDFTDTGDIAHDLRAQLRAFADLMGSQRAGRAVRQLIGAAQNDADLRAAFAAAYSHPRRDEAVMVLRRAVERGQLRPDAPLDVLVDQLWGACYHRILVLDEPVDHRLIDRLIHNALHGAAPQEIGTTR